MTDAPERTITREEFEKLLDDYALDCWNDYGSPIKDAPLRQRVLDAYAAADARYAALEAKYKALIRICNKEFF